MLQIYNTVLMVWLSLGKKNTLGLGKKKQKNTFDWRKTWQEIVPWSPEKYLVVSHLQMLKHNRALQTLAWQPSCL